MNEEQYAKVKFGYLNNWRNANARVSELEAEVAKLEYRLKHMHKECENCTMTALDTTGLNICDGCGQKIWEGEE